MEIAISVFIGLWFVFSGIAATVFIFRDFGKNFNSEEKEEKSE